MLTIARFENSNRSLEDSQSSKEPHKTRIVGKVLARYFMLNAAALLITLGYQQRSLRSPLAAFIFCTSS